MTFKRRACDSFVKRWHASTPLSKWPAATYSVADVCKILRHADKEFKIKYRELDVREQETRVRDAKSELDLGYARLKADFEKEYAKLKSAYEREVIKLEREKTYLEVARNESDKGFD